MVGETRRKEMNAIDASPIVLLDTPEDERSRRCSDMPGNEALPNGSIPNTRWITIRAIVVRRLILPIDALPIATPEWRGRPCWRALPRTPGRSFTIKVVDRMRRGLEETIAVGVQWEGTIHDDLVREGVGTFGGRVRLDGQS